MADLLSHPEVIKLFRINEVNVELYAEGRHEDEIQIIATGCSDPRVDTKRLEEMLGLKSGKLRMFRNIGGKFKPGHLAFGNKIESMLTATAIPALFLVTYHFSQSDEKHMNCGGHGDNASNAIEYCTRATVAYGNCFGSDRDMFYPVMIGINTDHASIVFHR